MNLHLEFFIASDHSVQSDEHMRAHHEVPARLADVSDKYEEHEEAWFAGV